VIFYQDSVDAVVVMKIFKEYDLVGGMRPSIFKLLCQAPAFESIQIHNYLD
jgi:hypothetical protein